MSWNKVLAAVWDPFLATVARQSYMDGEEITNMHHTISILTFPTDSISWTFDVNLIPDDSIFNESNWKKETSNGDYYNYFSWFYQFE